MAVLENIILQNFRNIAFAQLQFSSSFNCICGRNGQGKTNLLDAIYYLSMTKSAMGVSDHFCTRHGSEGFTIAGTYRMNDGMNSTIALSVDKNGKTIKRDGKAYKTASAHIGILPIITVSPLDASLVSESGEERRRAINAVISQINPMYLASLQRYNRFLIQRNRMLKEAGPDASLLDVIDAGMSKEAAFIYEERRKFTVKLETAVRAHYKTLSGDMETVGIEYSSELDTPMEDLLRASRQKDLLLKFTTVGIQRDDFIFTMNGQPIRKCGSQGQQKCFLIAFKLAHFDIIREACGFPPILLLDDVFDKLDSIRIENLIRVVNDRRFGQIFITDTDRKRLEEIIGKISSDTRYFEAHNGEF